jgi:glycine hydroxymethyltransferase
MDINCIRHTDAILAHLIKQEQIRQSQGMELIASENYQSKAVLEAQSCVFANKYSEGYPGRRYYGWQEYTDDMEDLAIQRAKRLFGSTHANVQALSGAAANVCFYTAWMDPGDTILGMNLSHGGHLTHGAPVTFMSRVFHFVNYGVVDKISGEIDRPQVRNLALQHKPKIIIAWFSAYPRQLDFARFVEIAQEVDAVCYADVAHIGWFIAADILPNPLNFWFDAMMTTTHKSFRGPRWAMILTQWIVSNPLKAPEKMKQNLPTLVDRAVFPGMQGGPHMNTIAGIAVALQEASTPGYKVYAQQVLDNAQVLAQELVRLWYTLFTWGTDNHMVIVDFSDTPLDGDIAQKTLDRIGISTSKSTVPFDNRPPYKPSGLRIGMQAMTTRGITPSDTLVIVRLIDQALQSVGDDDVLDRLHQQVKDFCLDFPVPSLWV